MESNMKMFMMEEYRDSILYPSPDSIEKILKKKKHVEFQKPIKGLTREENDPANFAELKTTFQTMISKQNDEIANLKLIIKNLKIENRRLKTNKSSISPPIDNNKILFSEIYNKDDLYMPPINQFDNQYQDNIKSQLLKKSAELNIYKEKVLELQCKLVELTDGLLLPGEDKNGMNVRRLEQQLMERKGKLRALENAYRSQDKVIEKFEEIFRKQLQSSIIEKPNSDLKIVESLLQENNHLKLQLNRIKDVTVAVNQSFDDNIYIKENNSPTNDLSIEHRLETLERRAISLEKQMVQNTRTWVKEKEELTLKVKELEARQHCEIFVNILDKLSFQCKIASLTEVKKSARHLITFKP